jgi:hypothetical protein
LNAGSDGMVVVMEKGIHQEIDKGITDGFKGQGPNSHQHTKIHWKLCHDSFIGEPCLS